MLDYGNFAKKMFCNTTFPNVSHVFEIIFDSVTNIAGVLCHTKNQVRRRTSQLKNQ